MHILMAAGVPRSREGGVAAILYNLKSQLEQRGHRVSCMFLDDFVAPSRVPRRFIDIVFAYRLARYIQRNRRQFTVVNLHAPWGFAYGSFRRFSSRDLPPYVMTLQAVEERYADAMRVEARKGRAANFRWKNQLWHRLYRLPCYHRSILTADHSMVANREAAAYLQLHHHLDAGRVWYIPNGVEESFFTARRYDSPPRRLLFVGTWLDRKGIYYLTDTFRRLAAKVLGLRLTIAGCLVQEEIVRRGFPQEFQKQVDVEPFVPAAEMPRVYSAHDIFVFPSLVEGMPLSLLEAMASGLPVVTTDTCGMSDVVESGRNGLLVKPADSEAIVGAVSQLLDSVELRVRLGRAAQESMRSYTWSKVAAQVENVFSLAAPRTGRRDESVAHD